MCKFGVSKVTAGLREVRRPGLGQFAVCQLNDSVTYAPGAVVIMGAEDHDGARFGLLAGDFPQALAGVLIKTG